MNKQQCAFKWSAEYLRDTGKGKLYFWTFTWKDSHPAWHYMKLWHTFAKSLQYVCPDNTFGIRVVEMHPGIEGRSHGWHIHCLLNRWVDARRVWRLCRQHRMGCDAQRIKQSETDRAIGYIAKYLTKEAEPFPVRVRRVGSMYGFPMERISDVKLTHPASDSATYLIKFWGRGQAGLDVVQRIFNSPNCRGDWKTLLVGLHYQKFRVCDSFSWTDSRMYEELYEKYVSDWIDDSDSIYHPGRMPVILPEQPF